MGFFVELSNIGDRDITMTYFIKYVCITFGCLFYMCTVAMPYYLILVGIFLGRAYKSYSIASLGFFPFGNMHFILFSI